MEKSYIQYYKVNFLIFWDHSMAKPLSSDMVFHICYWLSFALERPHKIKSVIVYYLIFLLYYYAYILAPVKIYNTIKFILYDVYS